MKSIGQNIGALYNNKEVKDVLGTMVVFPSYEDIVRRNHL